MKYMVRDETVYIKLGATKKEQKTIVSYRRWVAVEMK
jgi:hypothetical protein